MKDTRFRVSSKINFVAIAITIFSMLIPLDLLFEFASTGEIDLYRITEGRGHIPAWIPICTSGVAGIYILKNLTIPWLIYVLRGHIFILSDNGIWIGEYFLENDEVIGFSQKYPITCLKTRNSNFELHAGWTENGASILNDRFKHMLDD